MSVYRLPAGFLHVRCGRNDLYLRDRLHWPIRSAGVQLQLWFVQLAHGCAVALLQAVLAQVRDAFLVSFEAALPERFACLFAACVNSYKALPGNQPCDACAAHKVAASASTDVSACICDRGDDHHLRCHLLIWFATRLDRSQRRCRLHHLPHRNLQERDRILWLANRWRASVLSALV